MKRGVLLCIGAAVALASGFAGFHLSRSAPRELAASEVIATPARVGGEAIVGRRRPDFGLAEVGGEQRQISEWDGKVIALNFWATWCPPCIKEIPEFVELQHKYETQGLQFIGIALQRPEEVTEFMQVHGMNYPVLAGEMEVIRIAEAYGNDIGALPYTVIIDRQGLVHYIKRGPLAGEAAEAIIVKLL